MNYLYILEEHEKGPSGVVNVVKNKILNWNKEDYIYLVLNKNHWAKKEFLNIKRKNLKIVNLNFNISHEININRRTINNFLFISKFFRLFLLPYEFYLNYKVFLYFRKIIKKYSIDVIFSHNGGWPGGILNRLVLLSAVYFKNVKKFIVIHNFPVKKNFFNFIFIKLNNFIIKKLNADIITVSKSCKKSLLNEIKLNKIKVIYNGIDKNDLKKKYKKKNKKNFNISYFGKIQRRKGLDLLIKASNGIEMNNLNINIYGNGEENYKKELKSLKNGMYKLNFHNYLPKIYQFIDEADIVVLPSIEFESFGMVLIEAMRQKKPIVCSNHGGMKEIVKNNVNGFLFKNKNYQDLQSKLLLLIHSKSKRKIFGKNGYTIFKRNFENNIFLESYKNL